MYNRQLLEQIELLSTELKRMLDPRNDVHEKLIQKGMMLFRHQHVYSLKFSNGKVEAKVRDVSAVHVELYFYESEKNTCTCPDQSICRHQIAVFFAIYSRMKSVFLWIQEWKDQWKVNDILSSLQRGSDLLKKKAEETEDTGPKQWLNRIHQAFQRRTITNPYQLEEWAYQSYRRLLRFAPVEREWKPLFQLFAACESIKVINEMVLEQTLTGHLHSFIDYMIEETEEAMIGLSSIASPFAFDEYFAYIRNNSRTFIEEETAFSNEFMDVYMKLWTSLFKLTKDRKQEWTRLESLQTENMNVRHKLAFIHLSILLEKDAIALEKLKQIGKDSAPFILRWIQLLQSDKTEARLDKYMPTFLAYITDHIASLKGHIQKTQFARALFQVIDHHASDKIDAAMLEKTYIQLLPYSRHRYHDYLLAKKDYRRWAEMQMYSNLHLEYIDRHTIELISKEDPAALSPLYHQTIAFLISQKSRDTYKRAVRYLKRLKKLYEKQKKQSQWEMYFEQLRQSTTRLRAFQEECRKGKLIE